MQSSRRRTRPSSTLAVCSSGSDPGSVRRSLRRVAGHGHSLTRGICRATRNLSGVGAARDLVKARCTRGGEIARMLGTPRGGRQRDPQPGRALERWRNAGGPPGVGRSTAPGPPDRAGPDRRGPRRCPWGEGGAATDRGMSRHLVRPCPGRRAGSAVEGTFVLAGARCMRCAGSARSRRARRPEPDSGQEQHFDLIAEAFATAIDAKSPYTYRHSEAVAALAVGIGERLEFSPVELRDLRRAALLHDIGKLRISNLILDRPGPLTPEEMRRLRRHPAYTHEILSKIARFRDLAEVANSHHERLDGTGYHRPADRGPAVTPGEGAGRGGYRRGTLSRASLSRRTPLGRGARRARSGRGEQNLCRVLGGAERSPSRDHLSAAGAPLMAARRASRCCRRVFMVARAKHPVHRPGVTESGSPGRTRVCSSL